MAAAHSPIPARGVGPYLDELNDVARGASAATAIQPDARLARQPKPWPVPAYILCLIIPIWFNAGPVILSTLRLYLLAMIIPLLVQLLMGRFGRILITDVLFIAHLAWVTLELAVNSPAQVVTQFGSVGVEFLGGYMIGVPIYEHQSCSLQCAAGSLQSFFF